MTDGVKAKEKELNNCLVICIGISKYRKGIPDIPEIKHDIRQYTQVFKDTYNYKVICNDYDDTIYTKKMFATKKHFIMQFYCSIVF